MSDNRARALEGEPDWALQAALKNPNVGAPARERVEAELARRGNGGTTPRPPASIPAPAVEDPFPRICVAAGLWAPVPEYRFMAPRRWRFDYAWPAVKVALEVEGGIWTEGRHTRGQGYLGDIAKYNAAQLAGWKVLRTTPDRLLTRETMDMLREALGVA